VPVKFSSFSDTYVGAEGLVDGNIYSFGFS